ncbi:MAG TPA: CHASE2 domain-containing protein [Bryobacteraceae bacterium]|jgi:signal transduction histidine kinase|nr:CHASE2 domain-containing protein [Bryobacteraceae bacterium]
MQRVSRQSAVYWALLAASFGVALAASWTFGAQIDNDAYDWMSRLYQPPAWQPESALLAIDEMSLNAYGGLRGLRKPLAEALERISAASPKAVAVDVILTDASDPETDARLAAAMGATRHLVLACQLLPDYSAWEDPLPLFAEHAEALGHVHVEQPDQLDSVGRSLPLEEFTSRVRRWALSLEAYRVSRGARILESPTDLDVGGRLIPASRADRRLMRIRYAPSSMHIPRVSLKDLLSDPGRASEFSGKVVFAGVTAQGVAKDWLFTPYSAGTPMVGVEIHANAFETIAQGLFITDAPPSAVLAFSLLLVLAIGLTYSRFTGRAANGLAVGILAIAHVTPYWLFTHRIVFSFCTPVSAAWLSLITAGAYQLLVVRRSLRKSEAETDRYRQTIHFVTHEMRTPLTAIQGSSELMGRYTLPEEKRKQIVELINAESKRLGRMIEMFLSMERLSAGQVELKKESFSAGELMAGCVARALPLAERKQIRILTEAAPQDVFLTGDRELMEYAFYNLLTNAIKYSPPRTQVTLAATRKREHAYISVEDQGIGMDQKEVKKIFQKFYRTKRAEQSGEAGTGIGLSIVEQIVIQHSGTIEVMSRPGEGSRFTMVLPAPVSAVLAGEN